MFSINEDWKPSPIEDPIPITDILIEFYSFFYWGTQVKAHGNKHFHIDALKGYIKEYANKDSSNIYKEYLDYNKRNINDY